MKKNFFKKLSLVMALAMTVTSVPASQASAAAAPTFKSSAVKLKIGETKKYGTANTSKYSVNFKIGKTSIATIAKSGKAVKVTGVAAGKTTLRMDAKSYSTKKVTQVRIPVTVQADGLQSAAQATTTKVVATFTGSTAELKTADFKIVKDSDNTVVAIKEAVVDSADATKVNITTYTEMKDGKDYTITCGEKTAKFTATDGKVADLGLSQLTITANNTDQVVKAQTLDAKGVIISELELDNLGNYLTVEVTTTNGYLSGKNLYLGEIGNTAEVKLTYHTYKYDENGNEVGAITKAFTVTAVKDATVISKFNYTIGTDAPSWDSSSFKPSTTIKIGTTPNAYFNIFDSADNNVTDTCEYSVESSDPTKFIINGTIDDNATGISVAGVSEGAGYILIKDKDGNTIKSLPVSVTTGPKFTSVTLDAYSFNISNSATAKEVKVVTAKAKDQYGDDIAKDKTTIAVTEKGANGTGAKFPIATAAVVVDDSKDTITFAGEYFTVEGSYTYKVTTTVGTGSDAVAFDKYVTVTAKKPSSANPSYSVSFNGVSTSMDAKVTEDNNGEVNGTLRLAALRGGVADSFVNNSDYEVILKNNKGVDVASDYITPVDNANGGYQVNVTKVASGAAVKMPTGTYTLIVNYDTKGNGTKSTVATKTFTVTDTQVVPTISVLKTNPSSQTDLTSLFSDEDYVKVSVDGKKISPFSSNIADYELVKTSGTTIYVKTVKVTYKVGTVDVPVTVTLNKVFTNVNAN